MGFDDQVLVPYSAQKIEGMGVSFSHLSDWLGSQENLNSVTLTCLFASLFPHFKRETTNFFNLNLNKIKELNINLVTTLSKNGQLWTPALICSEGVKFKLGNQLAIMSCKLKSSII